MEQYIQMIGKNVYTVRGKIGYLVVRGKLIISFFVSLFGENCRIILNGIVYCLYCLEQ